MLFCEIQKQGVKLALQLDQLPSVHVLASLYCRYRAFSGYLGAKGLFSRTLLHQGHARLLDLIAQCAYACIGIRRTTGQGIGIAAAKGLQILLRISQFRVVAADLAIDCLLYTSRCV